jgi:hypothetical protein
MAMKKEYDFSKGVRGRFYRPNACLKLPVYLDDDTARLVQRYADSKQLDVQTVVNQLIRSSKDVIPAVQVP